MCLSMYLHKNICNCVPICACAIMLCSHSPCAQSKIRPAPHVVKLSSSPYRLPDKLSSSSYGNSTQRVSECLSTGIGKDCISRTCSWNLGNLQELLQRRGRLYVYSLCILYIIYVCTLHKRNTTAAEKRMTCYREADDMHFAHASSRQAKLGTVLPFLLLIPHALLSQGHRSRRSRLQALWGGVEVPQIPVGGGEGQSSTKAL